jgi:predicted lipid-binding transport protein (Tim44 family)
MNAHGFAAQGAAALRSKTSATGGAVTRCLAFVALSLACEAALAATLGGFVATVGFFTSLAALLSLKLASAALPLSSLSVGLGILAAGAGGVVLARGFSAQRTRLALGLFRPSATEVAVVHVERLLPRAADRERLLDAFRSRFVAVQRAWDAGDAEAVRALTTPCMFEELRLGRDRGATPQPADVQTAVVTLNAHLLAYEEWPEATVASVEFTGLLRESPEAGAVPFRELWLLTRPNDRPEGWCLARHQALL